MSIIDDALDLNLDEVEDLPEFLDDMPAGEYVVTVDKVDMREVELDDGDVPVVQVNYRIDDVVALNKSSEEPPAIGSMFSESFFLRDMRFIKRYLKSVYGESNMQGRTLRELLDDLVGKQMKLTVKVTRRNDNVYFNTRKHTVLN